MADSDSETVPLLDQDTSQTEEDLDESRETETTDDECDEEFEDCLSDLSVQEQNKTEKTLDHASSYVLKDRSQNSEVSSNLEFAKEHKDVGCFSGNIQSSPAVGCFSGNIQSSPAVASNLELEEGREAIDYFSGNIQSSFGDSNKISSTESSVDLCYVIEYTLNENGDVDYIDIDFNDTISERHVAKLMKKLKLNHYAAYSCEGDFILSKCQRLFERDYFCETVGNYEGFLSRNYPPRLIIPVARKSRNRPPERVEAPDFDCLDYNIKVMTSVSSRLLTRFVVPVMLFNKKFICRSGSLTVRKTAVFETVRRIELPTNREAQDSFLRQFRRRFAKSLAEFTSRGRKAASQLFTPGSMQRLRDIDAEIMRDLNIQHICDLMVEDRKRFKQTISLSSSEKINRNIYRNFGIEQMPYPGCSFFRQYHDANQFAEGLHFNWNRPDVNTPLVFSVDPHQIFPDVNWTDYQVWDIVSLTRNYLKMLLSYLVRDRGGMLVHCISGWDRTPLFISLLRISLWADGVIHESLDYRDMAYLTLAYDWYLFGHNLPRRLNEKQEIMHFCFNFLGYIASDEFSVTRMFHELSLEEKGDGVFPKYIPEKRHILYSFRSYVLQAYRLFITDKL